MEQVMADTNRLLEVIEKRGLSEAGFTNVCVDGPNRDQPLKPYLVVGIYPTYPTYRAMGITDEAQGINGDEIRSKILTYRIREDFLRKHRAIVREFITLDTQPGSLGGTVVDELTNIQAEMSGLPVFFFIFSKYASDAANTTHMYFQKHLMPDELLGKVQQFIRDRALGKNSQIL